MRPCSGPNWSAAAASIRSRNRANGRLDATYDRWPAEADSTNTDTASASTFPAYPTAAGAVRARLLTSCAEYAMCPPPSPNWSRVPNLAIAPSTLSSARGPVTTTMLGPGLLSSAGWEPVGPPRHVGHARAGSAPLTHSAAQEATPPHSLAIPVQARYWRTVTKFRRLPNTVRRSRPPSCGPSGSKHTTLPCGSFNDSHT
jgi:hypothetical protein